MICSYRRMNENYSEEFKSKGDGGVEKGDKSMKKNVKNLIVFFSGLLLTVLIAIPIWNSEENSNKIELVNNMAHVYQANARDHKKGCTYNTNLNLTEVDYIVLNEIIGRGRYRDQIYMEHNKKETKKRWFVKPDFSIEENEESPLDYRIFDAKTLECEWPAKKEFEKYEKDLIHVYSERRSDEEI